MLAALEPQLERLPGATAHAASPAAPSPPMPVLTRAEQAVYDALSADPTHIDKLSETAGMETPNLLVTLLGLEFKGLVRQMAGKQFFRT